MSAIDTYALEVLFSLRDVGTVFFFTVVTTLGGTLVVGGIACAVGLYLLVREKLAHFAGLCVSLIGTILVVFPLKEMVTRARPDVLYQVFSEGGFSFPSGHASFSMALYGFLAYLAWQLLPKAYALAISVVAAILVSLIGFSRLYLGLHYASDVLAGYFIGAAFVGLGILLSEKLVKKRLSS